MFEKLTAIETRYDELMQGITNLSAESDSAQYRKHAKALADIQPLVEKFRDYKGILAEIEQAQELLNTTDGEMHDLAEQELHVLREREGTLLADIKLLLVPKDPNDEKNVILEIRAGTGGNEAGIFGADLFRMYSRFAERQGWRIDMLSISETGIGGIKEVIAIIEGQRVYSRLRYESGVHRVQRVQQLKQAAEFIRQRRQSPYFLKLKMSIFTSTRRNFVSTRSVQAARVDKVSTQPIQPSG